MKYLVDANVLSEVTKPRPSDSVVHWLRRNESEVAIDPIILGEIRYGIHLLDAGSKRRKLEKWFNDGVGRIQCLPWQAETGLCWARLLADLRRAGQSMPIKDSMIAATALSNNLIIATHNARDFRKAGVNVIDPFVHE